MKKYWLAALLGTLILTAGCKGNTDTGAPVTEDPAEEAEESPEDIAAGAENLSDAGKSAYRSVLEDIYYNQQFPNNLELDYDDSDISRNHFTVCDIDGDGRSELLISYTTASADSQKFLVYDFVEVLDAVREEFAGASETTFYENGVVRTDEASDMTESTEFQPFALYLYDEEEDSYAFLGSVSRQDDTGSYSQRLAGEETETTIDETVLKDWLDSTIGESSRVTLPMAALTEENIKALK